MELNKVLIGIHYEILALRNLETVLKRPNFERLWKASTKEQQKEVVAMIDKKDREGITQWIKNHHDLQICEKSTAVLKNDAYKQRIPNYSRMCKAELIMALEERANYGKGERRYYW